MRLSPFVFLAALYIAYFAAEVAAAPTPFFGRWRSNPQSLDQNLNLIKQGDNVLNMQSSRSPLGRRRSRSEQSADFLQKQDYWNGRANNLDPNSQAHRNMKAAADSCSKAAMCRISGAMYHNKGGLNHLSGYAMDVGAHIHGSKANKQSVMLLNTHGRLAEDMPFAPKQQAQQPARGIPIPPARGFPMPMAPPMAQAPRK